MDGGNAADFNNYIFGYYSDSSIFLNAMRRADIQPIARARIDMVDVTVDECVVDRTVTVQPRTRPQNNYGFTANGVIPLAACEPSVVPFIGNWWSVEDGEASVLSNNIAGQSAIFLSPADATITLVPGRSPSSTTCSVPRARPQTPSASPASSPRTPTRLRSSPTSADSSGSDDRRRHIVEIGVPAATATVAVTAGAS